MKRTKKIKDFIKSFFYYPKMKKYFEKRNMQPYDIWKSAIKYAKWHCQVGKAKPNDGLICDDLVKTLNNSLKKNDWKPVYRKEPIERKNNANT